ncbi:DUF3263 domain-containing protein [Curtobacterium sp. MCBD17_003]|uniref:DUF3263 domain-containing protein n=1 Tax=Curtobacterium sp. MCBD17_003 TaxID=2175667 RepID=UPI0021AC1CA5|nr:DUF3263 domain-containing protein [Curtobacterium sp. MCBD17_003]WIE54195.1 DUF3263 domain-containing protein [Curtobacterium sp. MCBD17_003]
MTDQEIQLLDFEQDHPRNDRRKEAEIRTTFGYSPVRYFQILNRLVKREDAVAAYPMLTRRLQRMTARAVRLRAERRFATHQGGR